MKKIIIGSIFVIFLTGCGRVSSKDNAQILARVNNYEITFEEFRQDFINSAYGRNDTLQSREDFLGNLIDRKLILQDAEHKGIDKDAKFLKMIERFWEQSLLKAALEKKSEEIAGSAFVSDKEIEAAYQKMKKDGKINQPYEQVYNQIKWDLIQSKESALMNAWLKRLRSEASVDINDNLLVVPIDKKGEGDGRQ